MSSIEELKLDKEEVEMEIMEVANRLLSEFQEKHKVEVWMISVYTSQEADSEYYDKHGVHKANISEVQIKLAI